MQELKQIQEENRKAIILANNPEAKSYEEAFILHFGLEPDDNLMIGLFMTLQELKLV